MFFMKILSIYLDHFQMIKRNVKKVVFNHREGGGYQDLSGSTTKKLFYASTVRMKTLFKIQTKQFNFCL